MTTGWVWQLIPIQALTDSKCKTFQSDSITH